MGARASTGPAGLTSVRRVTPRLVAPVATLVLSLALAACGADPAPGDGAPPGPADVAAVEPTLEDLAEDGTLDPEVLARWREAIEAMPREELEQRAADAARDVELELYALSGLTDELGGPEEAARSVDEAAQWLADLGSELAAPAAPRPAPFARSVGTGTTGSGTTGSTDAGFGAGLFGGMVIGQLGADAAVSSTNDGQVGTKEIARGVTLDAGTESVTLSSDNTFTDKAGVTMRLATRNTVVPCPGADGTFRASASVEIASTAGGGRTGKRATFDVEITGTVGEQAQLIGYDTQYRGQMADFKDSRGGFLDFSASFQQGGTFGGFRVNRTGGTVTDGLVKATMLFATLTALSIAGRLAEAAQKGWESGRCVRLGTTVSAGPTGLDPSSAVTITAKPRSKVDGAPTGGTVTAAMAGGEASVSPGSAPADATFTYTAPGEVDRTGSVALESRSRRGVGKATLAFDTRRTAYTASGGGELSFSGRVGDLRAPFELSASFPGGTTTFRFDGARDDGGAVRVTGGGSGARLTGRGTYTLADAGGGAKALTARVRVCVDVSGVCRSVTHPIRLTPSR